MKKKLLALVLVVVLGVTSVVGGTMAYLQDTDSNVNVMTLGNVDIEQLEYERKVNADGTYATIETVRGTSYELVDFTQAKPLLPTTCELPSSLNWDTTNVYFAQLADGEVKEGDMHYYGLMNVFPAELTNVQDKFVFVENTGKTDAYVRTIIALEAGSCTVAEWDSLIKTSTNGFWTYTFLENTVNIDGNNYVIMVCDYTGSGDSGTNGRHPDGIVHPGDYTYNNLAQVYMTSKATNKDVEALDGNNNGTYDILVLSQAVQTAGFENAAAALTAGFGEVNAANVQTWFGDMKVPTVVTISDLAGLKDALDSEDPVIVDAKDNDLGDLDDTTFKDGTVIKNATFTGDSSHGSYGNNAYGTVTFINCTFKSDYAYAAHFDGGNGELIFIDCEFEGWNSFGTAITGLTFTNCTFGHNGKYGLVRVYQDATFTDCTFESDLEGVDTNVAGTVVHFNNCTGISANKIHNNTDKNGVVATGVWYIDGVDVSAQIMAW